MLKYWSMIVVLAAPRVVFSFSVSNPVTARRTALCAIDGDCSHQDESFHAGMQNLVATSAVALALIMPSCAIAQDTPRIQLNDNALYSSTVTLSDVIKTMDFSLPSSYDSIADPVASGVDELTIVQGQAPSKKVEKKKEQKKATSVNKGMSVPSFFGGGEKPTIDPDAFKPKTTEEKAAILAARRAEREAEAEAAARAKVEAEKEARAELDASIKAARLEKIARREEEMAKKAAEESAKKDQMFNNVKVVDTSMPQY